MLNPPVTKSVMKQPTVDSVARVTKEEREDTTAALVDTEASVAKEEREDTTEASHSKILDVKSFVTSLTYQMVIAMIMINGIITVEMVCFQTINHQSLTSLRSTMLNPSATKSVTKQPPADSVAKEEREDTTEASHSKILDVKSFVTSLTYQMVSTTTLEKAIVTKVSFTKFVLKVLADSDMVARVEREERVDTTVVSSVDTEVSVDMVVA